MSAAADPGGMTMGARVARLVRLMLPGGNPVSRRVDRVEGYSLLAVVLFGTALLPIMLVVGSLTYARIVETGEQRASTYRQVVATLVEDAPHGAGSASGEGVAGRSRVLAEWRVPGGAERTGRIQADGGLRAGAQVTTWVDRAGDPVTPPATPADAGIAAMLLTVTGWCTGTAFLGAFHACLKRLLDRRRYQAWGREWARVGPGWRMDR